MGCPSPQGTRRCRRGFCPDHGQPEVITSPVGLVPITSISSFGKEEQAHRMVSFLCGEFVTNTGFPGYFASLSTRNFLRQLRADLTRRWRGYENGSPLSKWLSVRTPWCMVRPILPANLKNRTAPSILTARPNIWGAQKTFATFPMSSSAEHHSCKQSIAIGSVQIRE